MTTSALELLLHDLSTRREVRGGFAEDPDKLLARYRLDDLERAEVRAYDVAALQRRGVSPLLTYGFWLTSAPERTRKAYLARLRGETGAPAAPSAPQTAPQTAPPTAAAGARGAAATGGAHG